MNHASKVFAWAALTAAVALMEPAARAEVPSDPPGKYSTSWLGNTYMDAAGHKNVTEELADLCLSPDGKPLSESEGRKHDMNTAEAIRRWKAGGRVLNTNWFEMRGTGSERRVYYKGTDRVAEGAHVRLNSDLAYPEVNVRYFLADMYLGGSRDFYHRTAEAAHEMGCQEAVARFDTGVKVTNLDQFERKKVDGKVLITRKRTNERISGTLVKLSTDLDTP